MWLKNKIYKIKLIVFVTIVCWIIDPIFVYAQVKPVIKVFKESSACVQSLSFSEDGRYIVCGFEDTFGKSEVVKIWDLKTGSIVRSYGRDQGLKRAIISPDGKYALLHETFQYTALLDAGNCQIVKRFENFHSDDAIAFSSDNRYVLIAGRDSENETYPIWLYDLKTGEQIRKFEGESHQDYINSVAFSPDNRYAASGSRDYTIKLWDVNTGMEIHTFEGHSHSVKSVVFSRDGKYLLSGAVDNSLRVWDVNKGEEIRSFDMKFARNDAYNSITLSADGKYVLSARIYGPVILWDYSTGAKISTLKTGSNGTTDIPIAFSPDGRFAATGQRGETIKIWDLKKAEEIVSLTTFDDGEWVAMTPEGYFNISQNGAKHLKIKVGNSTYSIDNFFERYYYPTQLVQRLSGMDMKFAHDIRKGIEIPPKVRITNPKIGESFDQDIVEVIIEAKDMGGGVDEIRLFHNDCVVGENVRGIKIEPREKVLLKKYKIRLLEGDNLLRAVGFSKDRTEGKPHTVKVQYTGKTEEIDLYLLVVGINKYKNPDLELNFALADAKGLKDFFAQRQESLFDKIHINEIYDSKATKKNIVGSLKNLNAQEQDVVIIYVAGHGLMINDEWYFVGYDLLHPENEEQVKEKGMSSSELAKIIMDVPALKKVIFIDACKSGGLLLAFSRGLEDRRAIAQLARSTGTHVVAASTDEQHASEVSRLGHGVFTYTLLQGLKGDAQNQDNIVTIRGLMTYIESELPAISEQYRQKPQFPVIDSRGQDFPLVKNK